MKTKLSASGKEYPAADKGCGAIETHNTTPHLELNLARFDPTVTLWKVREPEGSILGDRIRAAPYMKTSRTIP